MKRFAAAFFVIAIFLSNLAAQAASATFATPRGEVFHVILDGRPLPGPPTNFIRLDRLPAGPHNVEFRIPARRGFITYGTRIFLDRGFETNYQLVPPIRNGVYCLQKLGMVPLRPPVAACATCPPSHGSYNYNSQNPYDDYDYYDGGNYNQNPGNGHHGGPGNHAPGNGSHYNNNYNNQPSYPQNLMTATDVDLLIDSMKRRNFESAKAEIAKQALGNQLILAEDAKLVMKQFTFESNRLDFAKFVYPRIYDQQNFYRLYDAFEFNSSITEMERWLKR